MKLFVNVGLCRIMMQFSWPHSRVFFFSFLFVIWLPCGDIIYYWGSSAGYQPGKWNNVNKKWVCGSPLSRDYYLLALQHIILWERQIPGHTDGLKSWIRSLFFVLCHCHVKTLWPLQESEWRLSKNYGLNVSETHLGFLKSLSTWMLLHDSQALNKVVTLRFSLGGNNAIIIFPYFQKRWICKMQKLTFTLCKHLILHSTKHGSPIHFFSASMKKAFVCSWRLI